MSTVPDNYESYYYGKLWSLLPEVYRAEDSATIDAPGPLRELVQRISTEAATLRRSIDRLWEDSFIETCEDWLIPYMAELLNTNLVASLDARGQRLDVAKTIYYRRRKGTVPVLEELAADLTGWDARVVEFFRLIGRRRHGLDPAIGLPQGGQSPDELQLAQGITGPISRTPMGGFADLRSRYGASRTGQAFDEFAHTPDMRKGQGRTGWHNIPRLGVFVWRRKSYLVNRATPVAVTGCPDWYTFDPTGRDIPLYCDSSRRRERAAGNPAQEWQMAAPIDGPLLSAFPEQLYSASENDLRSVGVFRPGGLVPFNEVTLWPERGRFKAVNGPPLGVSHYGFSSEIGAGAYDRREHFTGSLPAPALPVQTGGGLLTVPAGSGTATMGDSLTYGASAVAGIQKAAIVAKNETRPLIRMTPGLEWRFTGTPGAELVLDGLFVSGPDVILAGQFDTVTIRSCTFDPGSAGDGATVFASSADGRPLRATNLFIEGMIGTLIIDRSICGPVRTRSGGVVDELRVSDSIVQGLRYAGLDIFTDSEIVSPLRLAVKLKSAAPLTTHIRSLLPAASQNELNLYNGQGAVPASLLSAIVTVLNGIVAGPNFYNAPRFVQVRLAPATIALRNTNPSGASLRRLNRLLLEDAFPYELAPAALAIDTGETHLERVTVLGRVYSHRFHASESILDDVAFIEDVQRGCVRFSAWTTGSALPRQYESVRTPPQGPLFESRAFGHPGYGQLLRAADLAVLEPAGESILEGAQNGSEMGAFYAERNVIKERSLLTKFEEYMPIGLSPVVVQVT